MPGEQVVRLGGGMIGDAGRRTFVDNFPRHDENSGADRIPEQEPGAGRITIASQSN